MSIEFVFHILISATIFAILASGFKLFVRVKNAMDFSYMAIVIVGAYAGSLANIYRGTNMFTSILFSFLISLPITFLILFLSKKLNLMYFTIGTFTLYVLVFHLSLNLDNITGGALGLSGMTPTVFGSRNIQSLSVYFFVFGIICLLIIGFLSYFSKTHIFKFLTARGENEKTVEILGTSASGPKLLLICLTTLLAVIGGNLYSFYYLFIDPKSFWFGMTLLLLMIVLLTSKKNDFLILGVTIIVFFVYEYLRFFKFVDSSKLGYTREMLFGLFVMIASRFVYRKMEQQRKV